MNGDNAVRDMENRPDEFQPDQRLYNDAYIRLGMLGIRNVADLGCGAGPFAEIMKEKQQRKEVYWGVDLDMNKIEEARRRHPGWRFAYGDFLGDQVRLEFAKHESFLLLNVLEYLDGDDDLDLLRGLPSGRPLVLSTASFLAPGAHRAFEDQRALHERYSPVIDIKFVGKYLNAHHHRWLVATAYRW